jgi:hypothetical protein
MEKKRTQTEEKRTQTEEKRTQTEEKRTQMEEKRTQMEERTQIEGKKTQTEENTDGRTDTVSSTGEITSVKNEEHGDWFTSRRPFNRKLRACNYKLGCDRNYFASKEIAATNPGVNVMK